MIRVLLAVESQMLSELKEHIERDDNMEVVGEVSEVANPLDLLLAVDGTQANVVIHGWPESQEMPGVCTHLLAEFPDLLVIGIPPSRDRAVACRQTITKTTIRMAGMEDLLAEIRQTEPALR
jgi:hypothetical protein